MLTLTGDHKEAVYQALFSDEETLHVSYDGTITVPFDESDALALAETNPELAWEAFHISTVVPFNHLGEYTLHEDGVVTFEAYA